jgi:hypothetical protein
MEEFNLSRFLITGYINSNTPLCVIEDIASAHGVNFETTINSDFNTKYELIKTIINTKTKCVNLTKLTHEDYKYIARFVNKNTDWNKKSLIKSFNFLVKFIKDEKIESNFTIGNQDNYNIYNINSCVLYKFCMINNIQTRFETTVQEMEYKLKMLFLDHSILSCMIRDNIDKLDKSSMVNIIPYEKTVECGKCEINHYPENNYKLDSIIDKYKYLSRKIELQERFISFDKCETIILSMINCGINLSYSKYPLIDYRNIMKVGISNFIPEDKWFRYWYGENPELFDISKTFCPLVPIKYYNSSELFDMAMNEGFSRKDCTDASSCYELLQIAKIGNNFYDSRRPGIKSDTTSILMIYINDIPKEELFFYGVDGVDLEAITIDELIDLFTHNNDFTDPFDPHEIIDIRCIRKLKYFLSKDLQFHNDTTIKKQKLLNIIISLELRLNQTDKYTSMFINFHIKSIESEKEKHVKLLTILLELGMYLRGWDGSGEYPMNGVKLTGKLIDNNSENIWNHTFLYEEESDKLEEFGKLVYNLPLIYYKSGKYIRSFSKEHGLTIKDRINIFKEGSNSTNINSCTKMSSNWIIWSSYKYLTLMGSIPDFKIYNLKYIEE